MRLIAGSREEHREKKRREIADYGLVMILIINDYGLACRIEKKEQRMV